MNSPPCWTPAMVATLKELLAAPEYMSCYDIASIITAQSGVPLSRNAVAGKVNRDQLAYLRIAKPPKTNKPKRKPKMFTPPVLLPLEHPTETSPPLSCTLFELRPNSCRWPLAVNEAGEHLFCGVVKPPERSYCAEHYRNSYSGRR